MPTVFLSYAEAEGPFARRLIERLINSGHKVTWSQMDDFYGEDWREALDQKLSAADAFVPLLSSAYLASRHAMQQLDFALGYSQPSGRPRVMPVVLDEIPVPPKLNRYLILFEHRQDIEALAERLGSALDFDAGRAKARLEERRETQKRIEDNAAEYINKQLRDPRASADSYRRFAQLWYGVALLSLTLGLAYAAGRALQLGSLQPTWPAIAHFAISGVLVVGILGALSRLAFILGKSFMVESLRNADRIHAISFGQFYLKTFPDKTEWSEIKEAFQHWNIDSGSSFITQNAGDIDPQILLAAVEMIKSFASIQKGRG